VVVEVDTLDARAVRTGVGVGVGAALAVPEEEAESVLEPEDDPEALADADADSTQSAATINDQHPKTAVSRSSTAPPIPQACRDAQQSVPKVHAPSLSA
jgi:hypothetical protein